MGTMKTILGPKSAFIVAGEGSPPLPEAERQTLLKLMQRNVVALLKAREQAGFSAVAAGSATVDGKAAELVAVTREEDTVTLAIDPVTGQVLQSSYAMAMGGLGQAGELVTTYSDYRKGAGPTGLSIHRRGHHGRPARFHAAPGERRREPKLDEALFQPPPPHTMFPGADELPPPSPPPALPPAVPRPTPSALPNR